MVNPDELKNVVPTLESEDATATKGGYSFASDDDLAGLLFEMQEEKEVFEKTPVQEDFEEQKPISQAQKKQSNTTAEFAVKTLDKTIATALAVYAKSQTPEDFYADDDDIKELAKYWGVYFQYSSMDLPPWVIASVFTLIVMTKKFRAANSIRKVNMALESERKKTADLESQIKELKKKKEINELKQQVQELQEETKDEDN